MQRYGRYRGVRFAKDEVAFDYLDEVHAHLDKALDEVAKALAEYTKAIRLLDSASRDRNVDYDNLKYIRDVSGTVKIMDKSIRNLLNISNNANQDLIEIKRKL